MCRVTLHRWKCSFRRPFNMILLGFCLPVMILTMDWSPLAFLIAIETLWYLIPRLLLSVHSGLQGRIEDDGMDPREGALLFVTIAGIALMVLFGFGKHIYARAFPSLSHSQGWEVGALAWTVLFLVVYWFKVKTDSDLIQRIILLFLALAGAACVGAAYRELESPVWHAIWVWVISLLLLSVDLLLARHAVAEDRESHRVCAIVCNLPMVLSFLVLILYCATHRDAENPEIFLSGAISLQFVISNAVFIVTEAGWLRISPAAPLRRFLGAEER